MADSALVAAAAAQIQQLIPVDSQGKIYVAYSGGVDSSLLLYLVCKILGPDAVTAVHVNHGLSINAAQWEEHCRHRCKLLGIPIKIGNVKVANSGSGLEAAARAQRYQFFSSVLPQGALLLMGHHQDDQVETFFLRLFRGAGAKGLAAMERLSQRDHYYVARPLLAMPRADILKAARQLELTWVEDESNQAISIDRNYLRNEVLPRIEARWPGYRQRITNSQQLLRSPSPVLAEHLNSDGSLRLGQTAGISREQQLSLLHAWLAKLKVAVPSVARLEQILDTVWRARADAEPAVALSEGEVRRYLGALHWVDRLPALSPTAPGAQVDVVTDWPGIGQLTIATDNQGIGLDTTLKHLNWRLRQGGESLRPAGRERTRDLKRLLQEQHVKPWLRGRLPLLFSGETLVAVADLFISADHLALAGKPNLQIKWQPERQ